VPTDDGIGLEAERTAGVGLTSMRERAAELGGSCVVETLVGEERPCAPACRLHPDGYHGEARPGSHRRRPSAGPRRSPVIAQGGAGKRETLDLIAQGRSNAEIAARLVLSPKTVRNHVSNVLNKLQVADRTEAAVRAREAGLGI